jgi:hypothetical protein
MRLALVFLAATTAWAQQVDVLMSQYDRERTAANLKERVLRPANVNTNQFGRIGRFMLDASTYALPLIVSNVDLPGGQRRNVLIAATMGNTVYAFDADNPANTTPIWSRNLGPPMPSSAWTGPVTWGILSTPFIDRASNTIYVVAKVVVGVNYVILQISALDLFTGNLKFNSPQTLTFPVEGGATIENRAQAIQRAGLLVSNGVVFVAVANIVIDPLNDLTQEGYLQSFNATNLSERYGSVQITPTGLKGGIWQAGRGISADPEGNVYAATAGGFYDGLNNFGSSVLKFAPPTLTRLDWFTPANHDYLFHNNIDLSANGVMLLPGTNLAIAGGKEGVVYLLNRDNMGRLEGVNGPLQRFDASEGCGLIDCTQSLGLAFWSRPASPQSTLFVWDRRDFLRAFTFNNATQRFTTEVAAVGPLKPEQTGGPTVSALGEDVSTGVVWAVTVPTDANGALVEGTLRAYRGSNIAEELYNSAANPARDAVGFFTKFATPVVANGKVYVPTQSNWISVYGLLSPRTLTVAVNGSGVVTGNPGGFQCSSASCVMTTDEQTIVQLNAQPGAGKAFGGWSGGTCAGLNTVCNVSMEINKSVTATFGDPRALNLGFLGNGSGTLAGGGLNCSTPCSNVLAVGTTVTLTATPAGGSAFGGWAGSAVCPVSSSPVCTFVLGTNTTVSAVFTLQSGVTGYQFLPIAPCRAADTRETSAIAGLSSRAFTFGACGIPANAAAVALNVTVVPQGSLGYLTIWPTGQTQPVVSTMNSLDGRVKANAAIVGTGTGNAVSVFVTNTAHVILDVSGYFVPPGTPDALSFYAVNPCRALDTRAAGGGGALAALETRLIPSGPCLTPTASAYSLNMTVIPPGPLGYLTVWPAVAGQPRPVVSTLNDLTGTIVANAAIVQAGTAGALNAFVTEPSHLLADLNGYFAAPGSPGALLFYPVQPCRIADTRESTIMVAAGTRDFGVASSGCAIPTTAQAYALNATVIPPGLFGYLTLWPNDGSLAPVVSTLNALDGALTSNAAIVRAGIGGSIRAFPSNATHLLLDISGYFAP